MAERFEIEARDATRAGQRILSLAGSLSVESVPEFLNVLRAETARIVIVDLGRATFVDSAGVGALIQAQVSLQNARRRLVLVAPSQQVLAVLDITRVRNLFSIFSSLSEAEAQLT